MSIVDETGFCINNENSYASGKVKRPRGPRSSLTVLRIRHDLETRAVDDFLLHHVLDLSEVPDVAHGLCGCIGTWKASERHSLMVDSAIACLSLAVYARTRHCDIAAVDASANYGRLLRMMQEKLKDFRPSRADADCIDAYLLTMFIMGRYEVTMHNYSMPARSETEFSLQRWIHHEGALAILKGWSDAGHPNGPTTIMKLGRRGVIQSSLRQNVPLPGWIVDGSRFGERDLGLQYDRIMVATVDLYQAMDRQSQCNLRREPVSRLVTKAQAIDQALQEWASTFLPAWALHQWVLARPCSWPTEEFYPSTVYILDKPGYTAVWLHYFAMRMLVNSLCLTMLDRAAQSLESTVHESQKLQCLGHLHSMADSLASALLCLIGRVFIDRSQPLVYQEPALDVEPSVASLVVWPLAVAACVDGVELQQQRWFRRELARVGTLIGNGFFELAASANWTILGGSHVAAAVTRVQEG